MKSEYKEVPKYVKFYGSGVTLGGEVRKSKEKVDLTKAKVEIDETKETTSIRIRCHNGM